MKVLKIILKILLALFALLTAMVLYFAFHPEQSERLGNYLYGNQEPTEIQEDIAPQTNASKGQETPQEQKQTEADKPLQGSTGFAPQEDLVTETSHYDPPSEDALEIPYMVSGKNGYQPVQETGKEVDDTEAKETEERLGTGETGDGLTFDPLFYPYYAMLDEKGQHLYRQIYANMNAINEQFAPVEAVSMGQLKNVFSAVINDHPELFFVDTAYQCKYKRSGECIEIDLSFNRLVSDLNAERARFEQSANEVINAAAALPSDYEKEKYVHNALIDKVTYQLGAELNQTAYSALVNGQTVCAGYARALQYMLQKLQIPCYYCTGYSGENHAWNIVRLEEDYYNVDTTWDDTDGKHYDYFNKTDQDFAGTHIRKDLSVYLPPCNGTKYANLEENDDGLRSFLDTGLPEEFVMNTLADYYSNCYNQVVANGLGQYQFANVLTGEEVFEHWKRAYDQEEYRQGFLEAAMRDIGAENCSVELTVEPLKNGQYLIAHQVNMW